VEDVEEIIQFAKRLTLETGRFMPTVFLKGSEGKVAIGIENFGKTDEKQKDMLNAGAFTALRHHVGELELLVIVSEAWMSMANEKGELEVRPSLDPKRIETLIVNSLDPFTQEETMTVFEMVRDTKGKVTDLKQKSFPKEGSIKGTLLPAFLKGYQMVRPTTN
jgi:hypothetical protein